MPWTTPVDRATNYTVTATDYNSTGQDDLAFLYGDTGWTNASAFTNSWVSGGAGNIARFMLMGRTVYLNGIITAGTLNNTAFTLPSGYRPSQTVRYATNANGAYGCVQILTTGAVQPNVGSTTNVAIDFAFSVT